MGGPKQCDGGGSEDRKPEAFDVLAVEGARFGWSAGTAWRWVPSKGYAGSNSGDGVVLHVGSGGVWIERRRDDWGDDGVVDFDD